MRRGDLQSRTIDYLRVVFIIYVVIIHSYTSTRFLIPVDDLPVYRSVSYLFSLDLAQVAVPGFFFLSGYLFFLHERPYKDTLIKCFKNLIIPYIFWNLLVMLMYLVIENVPAFSGYLSGNNLPVSRYNVKDFLAAFWDRGDWNGGNGTPILNQFWYIRNLIILWIASPVLKVFLSRKVLGEIFVLVLIFLWMVTRGQAFLIESIAFFSAGALHSMRKMDFLPLFRRYNVPVMIIYPVMALTCLLFRNSPDIEYFSRFSYIVGIIFTVNIISYLLDKGKIKTHTYFREASFFILAAHDPFLTLVKRGAIKLLPMTDTNMVLVYFLAPALVMAVCLGIFFLLRRYFPSFLRFITGSPKRVAADKNV